MAPAGATAAISCTLTGTTLEIDVSGGGDQNVGLRMNGAEIEAFSDFAFAVEQPCTGSPTTTNTELIDIDDVDAGTQRTLFLISFAGGQFISADSNEGAGDDEIEISLDGAGGTEDDLLPVGTSGGDRWRLGDTASGEAINLNLDEVADAGPPVQPDADDISLTGVEVLQALNMGGGNDTLDARGNQSPGSAEPEFTGPWNTGSSTKQLVPAGGDDHLFSGSGNNWRLEGSLGADEHVGGSGNDFLDLAFGADADTADGNGGTDSCAYLNHDADLTVDLRITTAQNTGGAGIDTLSDCEDLFGGDEDDTLIGTDGDNDINGGENSLPQDIGNDTMLGLGGNDRIDGSHGIDTVSYAEGSTNGVTVSLATTAAQATVGAGTDTLPDGGVADGLPDTENLTGSEFADSLTGNSLANAIDGGPGADTINLVGGTDSFDAYDGVVDTVDCGTLGENDTGVADHINGGDDLTDCDDANIDFSPQTSLNQGPSNGATINDPTPTYELIADEPSTFEYTLDGELWLACAATCTIAALEDGGHTIRLRAMDADENLHEDLTPITRALSIDTIAPRALIAKRPPNRLTRRRARYRFTADEAGISFQCKLDRRRFKTCKPRQRFRKLRPGRHRLKVRAVDLAGNVGPVAKDRFRVVL